MAQWQRKLDLRDAWKKAKNREITPQELAKIVADRLEKLAPFIDGESQDIEFERQNIVECFRDLETDEEATFDTFDYVLRDLYDWGDQALDAGWNGKKVCWIATNF